MNRMMDSTTLLLFIGASLALLLTPGPAVFYIVTRSVEHGRLAGLVSSLGIQAGTMIHILAATLGLSTVLMSSALAFSVVKYAGAAYLVYLGIRRFLDANGEFAASASGQRKLSQDFAEGVVVNTLNPKSAVFFMVFFPQFVDVTRGALWKQMLLLGLVFVCLAAVTETMWALTAGTAGQWLRGHQGVQRGMRYFSGSVYIALGLATAFAGSQKNK